MEYNLENDNELLFLVEENDERAEQILIKKYEPIINSIIKKYRHMITKLGLDESDLYQEGLLGLMRAIKYYDKDKCVLFYTYATICIDSMIKTSIRRASTQKNEILNSSFSLDSLLDEESGLDYYDLIQDNSANPESTIANEQEQSAEVNALKKNLTEFESSVLDLKLIGFTNEEIALILSKEKKSIENTISRIRIKYKNFLEKKETV